MHSIFLSNQPACLNEMQNFKNNQAQKFTSILKIILLLFSLSAQPVFASDLGLIEPNALYDNMSKWIVLDARTKNQWKSSHIPGALSFSWEDYTRKDAQGIPCRILPPSELAKALGSMGIDENKPIVVYGDADKSWGGEGWTVWVLSWLGHKGPIRVLNGGIQSWSNNSFSLKTESYSPSMKSAQYKYLVDNSINITAEDIVKNRSSLILVDTRSILERFRGRIEGSIHIPWNDFFSGEERKPLNRGEMIKLLHKKGIDTNKKVVYYCSGGIRSAYVWMVHQLTGLPDAINYEGGYEEWKRRN